MTKNNFDITFWVSITVIGVMLCCAFLLLKPKFTNKTSLTKDIGINNPVPIETRGLPGFIPNQVDDSVDVNFFTPTGMFEDVEQARKSGVYKMFRSADSRRVNPESVISISFAKKVNSNIDLGDFILVNSRNLKQMFPDQNMTIGIIHLEKKITEKFDFLGIPYQTIAFYIDGGLDRVGHDCAIFFFATPGGFWSINWTAPRKILNNERGRERGIFLSMIKYISMMILNPKTKNAIIVMP